MPRREPISAQEFAGLAQALDGFGYGGVDLLGQAEH